MSLEFGEVWETRHGPVMVIGLYGHVRPAVGVSVLLLLRGAVVPMWTTDLVRRLDE